MTFEALLVYYAFNSKHRSVRNETFTKISNPYRVAAPFEELSLLSFYTWIIRLATFQNFHQKRCPLFNAIQMNLI